MNKTVEEFRRKRYGNDTIDAFIIEKQNKPELFLNDFLQKRYGNYIIDSYNEYTSTQETVDNMSLEDFIKTLPTQNGGGNAKITKKTKKSILGKRPMYLQESRRPQRIPKV